MTALHRAALHGCNRAARPEETRAALAFRLTPLSFISEFRMDGGRWQSGITAAPSPRMLLNANARPELRNKAGLSCVEINSDPEMRRIVVGSQLRLAQGSRVGARGSAVRPPSELRKVRPPSSSGERRPPGDKVPAAAVGALGGSRLAEREVLLQRWKTAPS